MYVHTYVHSYSWNSEKRAGYMRQCVTYAEILEYPKTQKTSSVNSVCSPISFLLRITFINPLQSGPKCALGDLGLLILKERRWVDVLTTELTLLVSLLFGIPNSLTILKENS